MTDHVEQGDLSARLFPPLHFLFFARVGQLLGPYIFAVLCDQTVAIDGIKAIARFRFRETPVLHKLREQIGDAYTRASEANYNDLLLLQWNARYVDRRDQRRGSYSCRPLNVVIERAQLVSITGQESGGIGAGKVLPLQKDVRPASLNATYKKIDKSVILFAADPVLPPPDVERALQPIFVVGPYVEQTGKEMLGMNPTQRSVEGHLSYRNTHASRALIAEPKDAFPIAHHDAFHIVIARMIEDLFDPVLIRIAEKQAARLSPDFAKPLATLTHRRRIHQRKHLFDIADQQCVKQRLIRVLQIAEKAVLTEGIGLRPQGLHPALDLFIETSDVRRQ